MTTRTPQDYALTDDQANAIALAAFEKHCGRPHPWEGAQPWVIAAIKAAGAPQSGWLPIESALKGRTLLVGYWNALGNWRTVKATYYLPQTLPLDEDHYSDDEDDGYAPEGWYEESETHETILRLEHDPVAWMPLPLPPSTKGESANG